MCPPHPPLSHTYVQCVAGSIVDTQRNTKEAGITFPPFFHTDRQKPVQPFHPFRHRQRHIHHSAPHPNTQNNNKQEKKKLFPSPDSGAEKFLCPGFAPKVRPLITPHLFKFPPRFLFPRSSQAAPSSRRTARPIQQCVCATAQLPVDLSLHDRYRNVYAFPCGTLAASTCGFF